MIRLRYHSSSIHHSQRQAWRIRAKNNILRTGELQAGR